MSTHLRHYRIRRRIIVLVLLSVAFAADVHATDATISRGELTYDHAGKTDLGNRPDTLVANMYASILINNTVFGSSLSLTNYLPREVIITRVRQLRKDGSVQATAEFDDAVPHGFTQSYSVSYTIGTFLSEFNDYWAEFTVRYEGRTIVFKYQNGRLMTWGIPDQVLAHPDVGILSLKEVFSRGSKPYAYSVDVASPSIASTEIDADTLFVTTAGLGNTGIGVMATSAEGTKVSAYFRLSVLGRPSAMDDYAEVDEDSVMVIDVLANDVDPADSVLRIVHYTMPKSGAVSLENEGLRYVPNKNFHGTDELRYVVSNNVATDTATVSITVHSINDRPVFLSSPDTLAYENGLYSYTVVPWDVDGDELTLLAHTLPPFLDETDGIISGTPSIQDIGVHAASIALSDGVIETVQEWTIHVLDVEESPVVLEDEVELQEDNSIYIDALANDVDPDGLSLFIVSLSNPSHGNAQIVGDSLILYVPDENFAGQDSLAYEAADPAGLRSTGIVRINVLPVNDPPTPPFPKTPLADQLLEVAGDPDAVIRFSWDASEDVDGDGITYSWILTNDTTSGSPLWSYTGADLEVERTNREMAELLDSLGATGDETVRLFQKVQASDSELEASLGFVEVLLSRGRLVAAESDVPAPQDYAFNSVYPNPAWHYASVAFAIPEASRITLEASDLLGRRLAILVDRVFETPGQYSIPFDLAEFAPGVYLIRMQSSKFSQTKSIVIVR